MNFFEDRKIKKIARDEDIKAPDKYLKCFEQTLIRGGVWIISKKTP